MYNCSLGIDTSNYTTSVSVVSLADSFYISEKKLLPVNNGELGLRQSDAVFLHTKQMPELMEHLFDNADVSVNSIGVSTKPRNLDGSYMPCFLVGKCNAASISKTHNVPVFEFSHQAGHVAAALFGANRLDLINDRFIAVHLSGGTTEAVLVSPESSQVFTERIIARSLDLKAGQAIDRVGKMLGLGFPAGKELDILAQKGRMPEKVKVSVSNSDISLSGIENKCKRLFESGVCTEDISLFCISYIIDSLDKMISQLKKDYELPIVFCGGVSSNKLLREFFIEKYDAVFASPEFSSDNAIGVAVLSQLLFR